MEKTEPQISFKDYIDETRKQMSIAFGIPSELLFKPYENKYSYSRIAFEKHDENFKLFKNQKLEKK